MTTLRVLVLFTTGILLMACARSADAGGPADPDGFQPASGPSWQHPDGAVTFALGGGDMVARRGTVDAQGDLRRADGKVHALTPSTRTVIQRWLDNPAALAARADAHHCDFGADQAYLEVILPAAQSITLCPAARDSDQAAVEEIVNALEAR